MRNILKKFANRRNISIHEDEHLKFLRWLKLIHTNLKVERPFLLNFVGKLASVLQVPPFFICNFSNFVEFFPNNHLPQFREFVCLVDNFLRILSSHSYSFKAQVCISKILT